MELSITEFRRNLFSVVQRAMEGDEVWVKTQGRRFRIVPEGKRPDKLSRITPMQIVAAGVDLEDDSWKEELMRDWERKWDRRLNSALHSRGKASQRERVNTRQARGKA